MSFPRLLLKAGAPVASLILMLLAIIYLRAESWTAGTACLLLSMSGCIYSIRTIDHVPFSREDIDRLRPLLRPALAWGLVLAISFLVVYNVGDNFKSTFTDRLADVAWIVSILLGLLLVWGKEIRAFKGPLLWQRIKAHRVELGLLLLILVVALDLRTIGLPVHPYPWSGDEASVGIEGRRILRGEVINYFETGWSSQPNWSFIPTAVSEIFFGDTILAVRLVSALAGILAVLFLYLVGREMFNPAIGLMAAAFLASMPYHVHFSRIGVNNIMDSMMSSLVFWLVVRGMKREDPRYLFTAGTAAGLCLYTYVGTRLAMILALLFVLIYLLKHKDYFRSHRNLLGAFIAGGAISAAGQAAFFLRNWHIFLGRLGQEGIFLNGWLSVRMAQTGESAIQILTKQFTDTILVFIARPALNNFFNSTQPYLTILGSILFLLGMAYAFAYLLDPPYSILLVWFWSVILLGGILTLNPPAHTRLLMTTPVVALFMALGLYRLMEYLTRVRPVLGKAAFPVFLIAVSVISLQNISYYMFQYRMDVRFQDANGEAAMEIGRKAEQLGADYDIYVMGEPRFYTGFPTMAFIAPENDLFDLGPGTIGTFKLAPHQSAAFFASPENQWILMQVRYRYPGGERGFIYRKKPADELLLEYYILKR